MKLAAAMGFQWPSFAPTPLQKLIPHASPEAIDLIQALCHWDPNRRPTAAQCLQMPFFQVGIQRTPRLELAVDPLDSSLDLGDSGLSPLSRPPGPPPPTTGAQGQSPPPPRRSSSDFGDILAEELAPPKPPPPQQQHAQQQAPQQQQRQQSPEGRPPAQLSSAGSWGGFAPLAQQNELPAEPAPPWREAPAAPQRTPTGLPPAPRIGAQPSTVSAPSQRVLSKPLI